MKHRTTHERSLRVCVFLALVIGTAAIAASPAGATSKAAAVALQPGRNCVITIAPLLPGQAISMMSAPRCYATFAEAIADATNGRVQLPESAGATDITAATLAPTIATSSTIIGIDWINSGYTGSSLTWQVSNSVGCTTGLSYQSNVTGSWNNVISSSKAFAGCGVNPHYDLAYPNQDNGAKIFCTPNCSTMGAMNDATSYEEWRP